MQLPISNTFFQLVSSLEPLSFGRHMALCQWDFTRGTLQWSRLRMRDRNMEKVVCCGVAYISSRSGQRLDVRGG
jgi:hypothetical protein